MPPHYNQEDKVLLAVDCIIFGFDLQELKILLVRRSIEPEKGKWSLIGGFLKKDETLDSAASRLLKNLTGLQDIYMEQLYTYSALDRDPGQRTISVAYYALIDIHAEPIAETLSEGASWFSLNKAPKLIFDHDMMVEKAVYRLRRRALRKPIGFELLPEKFTMRQLQTLYEAIFDRPLDKRNFISKVNGLKLLNKLEEKDRSTSKKGAFLYRFDKEKYDQKVREGYIFKLR